MDAPEYNIKIKVRNNLLLKAIEKAGEVPGGKLAEKIGIPYTTLNDLVSLKVSPLNAEGEIKPTVYKICEYFNKAPFELWSEEQLEPLENNNVEIEASLDQLQSLLQRPQVDALEELYLEDVNTALYAALDTLTEREKEVLYLRFGLEGEAKTLKEIGELFNVNQERARQIEAKALRKLRNPKVSGVIRELTSDEDRDAYRLRRNRLDNAGIAQSNYRSACDRLLDAKSVRSFYAHFAHLDLEDFVYGEPNPTDEDLAALEAYKERMYKDFDEAEQKLQPWERSKLWQKLKKD